MLRVAQHFELLNTGPSDGQPSAVLAPEPPCIAPTAPLLIARHLNNAKGDGRAAVRPTAHEGAAGIQRGVLPPCDLRRPGLLRHCAVLRLRPRSSLRSHPRLHEVLPGHHCEIFSSLILDTVCSVPALMSFILFFKLFFSFVQSTLNRVRVRQREREALSFSWD